MPPKHADRKRRLAALEGEAARQDIPRILIIDEATYPNPAERQAALSAALARPNPGGGIHVIEVVPQED